MRLMSATCSVVVVVLAELTSGHASGQEMPAEEDGATDEKVGEAQLPVCVAPNTLIAAACGAVPVACQGIPDPRQRWVCMLSVCTAVAAYVDLGCPPARAPWPQWPYHR